MPDEPGVIPYDSFVESPALSIYQSSIRHSVDPQPPGATIAALPGSVGSDNLFRVSGKARLTISRMFNQVLGSHTLRTVMLLRFQKPRLLTPRKSRRHIYPANSKMVISYSGTIFPDMEKFQGLPMIHELEGMKQIRPRHQRKMLRIDNLKPRITHMSLQDSSEGIQ